jgi:hypothetical protein
MWRGAGVVDGRGEVGRRRRWGRGGVLKMNVGKVEMGALDVEKGRSGKIGKGRCIGGGCRSSGE